MDEGSKSPNKLSKELVMKTKQIDQRGGYVSLT